MEIDWWHAMTVGVLAMALAMEALAAYCHQKESLISRYRQRGMQPDFWHKRWTRLFWGRGALTSEPDFDDDSEDVYYALTPEFGSFLRGTSRLLVAIMFLVRYASGMPPPWTG